MATLAAERTAYQNRSKARTPRKAPTEKQRESRTSGYQRRKTATTAAEESRRTKVAGEQESRFTAAEKTRLRRETYRYESTEKASRRQQIHDLAIARQQNAAQNRQSAVVSRRRYNAIQSASTSLPAREGPAFSSPNVSLGGGLARAGLMVLALIVLYAVVTHAGNSSTAIGRVGGVLNHVSSSQPVFVSKKAV